MSKRSASGNHTSATVKRQKGVYDVVGRDLDIESSDQESSSKSIQLKRPVENIWSSDDEIPLNVLKKRRHLQGEKRKYDLVKEKSITQRQPHRKKQKIEDVPADIWSSDDDMPLNKLKGHTKRRIEDIWSSDDDIPINMIKRKKHLAGEKRKINPPIDKNGKKQKVSTPRTMTLRARVNKRSQIHNNSDSDDMPSRKRVRSVPENSIALKRKRSELPIADATDDDSVPLSERLSKKHSTPRGPNEPAASAHDAILRRVYYDVGHPAGFASVAKLAAATGVSLKETAAWLSSQDTYTLTKKVIRKFRRGRYLVHDIGALFQCDLVDMRNLSEWNDAVFLLTCIDCFSRRLWVVPIPDKRGVTVLKAFKTIFRDLKPRCVTFDKGKEFWNSNVLTYFKQNKIKYYATVDKAKSALVERVNRTIREKMNKIMTARGSRAYLKFLPEMVLTYNMTKHSATGMAPIDMQSKDVPRVWNYLYGGSGRYPPLRRQDPIKPKLTRGDRVRIARDLDIHEKASATYGWTPEVFTVDRVTRSDPTLYTVRDDGGEKIQGRAYTAELQKIDKPSVGGVYMIDKIKMTKGKGASRRLLVSWKGYESPRFDSWISEKDLQHL